MTLKDVKRNFLIDTATNLFLEHGIEDITIEDIAKAANVGEMTIYRYFGKKQAIVFEAVLNLQSSVGKDYFKMDLATSGYDKLRIFYNSYLDVFNAHPNYFRFIREFDVIMIKDEKKNLQQYEDGLAVFKKAFFDAYELGLKDGTIKAVDDLELFYFTTTHALIELCKKLSYENSVLPQDERINKGKEINCLINTFLSVITNS